MNGALLKHTWRSQRVKLAIVSTALAVWGFFLPVVYARFGSQFRAVMDSGIFPEQFARLGSGDIFSLPGSLALSFIHPITIILTSVFSVGLLLRCRRRRAATRHARSRAGPTDLAARPLPDAARGGIRVRRDHRRVAARRRDCRGAVFGRHR